MAQVLRDTIARPARAASSGRARLPWRDELVTVVLGAWLMVGLFVDGWAHNNAAELETFFTPWHALFYSGFAATTGWVGWKVIQGQDAGRRGLAAVPVGYGAALVGMVVFTVGGVGDFAWHEIFGIEQDLEALFSPTHLLLFVGIVAILSAPLRAAWATDAHDAAPGYVAFLPVLASTTLTAMLVAFMFMFWSAFMVLDTSSSEFFPQSWVLASLFVTTLFLTAPLLVLVRRWGVPFGTATTLFTGTAVLLAALEEYRTWPLIPAAVVAGVAADAALRVLRPSAARPVAFWTTGGVVATLMPAAWFATAALTDGIGWVIEMWTGTIVWSGLIGLVLAVLMLPPRSPSAAVDDPVTLTRARR